MTRVVQRRVFFGDVRRWRHSPRHALPLYGQSGRSRRELAAMRARLEKEQGRRNPLKAGPGAYYDIDFTLVSDSEPRV
jgi:hypothetical protein